MTTDLPTDWRTALETGKPITRPLKTDERVLVRITEGIYRQPASALRELISNAYDADATEVTILTDAPRFDRIIVRDNGDGISPEVMDYLIAHIGASSKKSPKGAVIGTTASNDTSRSRKGRKLIGRMGIGLFAVAQLTRHFQIITKTKGANFCTVADITLNMQAEGMDENSAEFEAGQVQLSAEKALDVDSHGTEILLLDIRKTTRDELASKERWDRLDATEAENLEQTVVEPKFHIGRSSNTDPNTLLTPPRLPWSQKDLPSERFRKLVQSVFDQVGTTTSNPSLEILFDKYLQLLWTLSLAAPLGYIETHPFDLAEDPRMRFFQISNEPKGQAKEIKLTGNASLRKVLGLRAPDKPRNDKFKISVDGTQLARPLRFSNIPVSSNAISTPLFFVGSYTPDLTRLPPSLTGGKLSFEGYLLWSPLVVPTEHRGVVVRIGDATGMKFDPYFMDYQVSENTRLRQLTAEIFVHDGMDNAVNIDRESFNFAHPHYQIISKWLHGAIKQFSNRQKAIGSEIRTVNMIARREVQGELLERKVSEKLQSRGTEEPVDVIFTEDDDELDLTTERYQGKVVFSKKAILPPSTARRLGKVAESKELLTEQKAKAIIQLLHGWGLLASIPYADQEKLIRDIIDILTFDLEA